MNNIFHHVLVGSKKHIYLFYDFLIHVFFLILSFDIIFVFFIMLSNFRDMKHEFDRLTWLVRVFFLISFSISSFNIELTKN